MTRIEQIRQRVEAAKDLVIKMILPETPSGSHHLIHTSNFSMPGKNNWMPTQEQIENWRFLIHAREDIPYLLEQLEIANREADVYQSSEKEMFARAVKAEARIEKLEGALERIMEIEENEAYTALGAAIYDVAIEALKESEES